MNSSKSISDIAAFCAELREARGYCRVSVAEVAAATRITRDYVEALESGEWGKIPPAYLRGYLALYSSAVGMNREKVLAAFDRLLAEARGREGAVLDESGPLLPQPEHVGVTRAKIRASWFAGMAKNRRVVLWMTAVALAALLVAVHLARRAARNTVPIMSFEQAVVEDRDRVHGPYTLLTVDSLAGLSRDKHRINQAAWTGWRPTLLLFQRDDEPWRSLRFAAYDTIEVEYLDHIAAKVTPRDGASAFAGGAVQVPPDTVRGDTADYGLPRVIKPVRAIPESAVDSLSADDD